MKPWHDTPVPQTGTPTMLSMEEKRYLVWLTKTYWKGQGHILEIGPWLGGSTECLAEGLSARHPSKWQIHSVDNFIWRPFMGERSPLPLVAGDSFLPAFQANLSSYNELVVPWQRALPDDQTALDNWAKSIVDDNPDQQHLFTWSKAQDVEILFVDGAKSWTGMVHLLRVAGPHLVKDQALLVCQDYKYWGCYWVPVVMELLADHIHLEHNLDFNTTSFRLVGTLPDSALQGLPDSVAALGPERATTLLESAGTRLQAAGDAHGAAVMLVALVRLLGNLGEWEGAREAFLTAERVWPMMGASGNLDQARAWLKSEAQMEIKVSTQYRVRRNLGRAVSLPRRIARRARRILST